MKNRYERIIEKTCPELIKTDAAIYLAALYHKKKRQLKKIDKEFTCEYCGTAFDSMNYYLGYYEKCQIKHDFETFIKVMNIEDLCGCSEADWW